MDTMREDTDQYTISPRRRAATRAQASQESSWLERPGESREDWQARRAAYWARKLATSDSVIFYKGGVWG